MNRIALFLFSFLSIIELVQAQSPQIVNQTTTLHITTTTLGVNAIEYLLQPKDGEILQKLLISPFKIGKKKRPLLLRNFRLNLVQEEGLTTLGIADGISWFSKKEEKQKTINQLLLGANVTLFPNWGSPSRDEDGDGLDDNFYSLAKQSFSLGYALITATENRYTLQVVYQKEREVAIEKTREVISIGYSAGFMRSIKFTPKKSQLPLKLKWGAVVEQSLPLKNQSALENGNSYELSIAPQFEVQFYSNIVFRTSIPFHVIEGKKDEREFASFFQLFFAI